MVITSSLKLLSALGIRPDCDGPVIFRQQRVDDFGTPFTVFQFRTTIYDNPKPPPAPPKGANEPAQNHTGTPAQLDDPRINRVGKWLCRSRLDEPPQLFNIVKGDNFVRRAPSGSSS